MVSEKELWLRQIEEEYDEQERIESGFSKKDWENIKKKSEVINGFLTAVGHFILYVMRAVAMGMIFCALVNFIKQYLKL